MEVSNTPEIEDLARRHAWFAFSVSGGKDSGSALQAATEWLDGMGHPRDRRIALHADLGRAEWPDTLDTVRAVAAHVGVDLEIVRQTNDLAWRFEDRWRRSLERYARLETINLVPPWSSSSLLFCRSEQKLVPLSRRKAKLSGDLPVVGVVGLRRQESTKRASTPVACPDGEMQRRNGREGLLWHPIVDWTTEQVFEHHADRGIPLHRAYGLGSTRLSCALCTIASKGDLGTSIHKGGNVAIAAAYSSLEIRSAFSFQTGGWLSDMLPGGIVDPRLLDHAKSMAAERVSLQMLIPRDVLRSKTIRNIQRRDAAVLADVRRRISSMYGLAPYGTNVDEIMHLSEMQGTA